jgi:hypothetical protein
VKVSRRPGDTVERVAPRRLATGFAIKLFVAKANDRGAPRGVRRICCRRARRSASSPSTTRASCRR